MNHDMIPEENGMFKNIEDFRIGNIEIGQDALNPEMKRERIMTKARALEGNPITDEEILANAQQAAADKAFRGIPDPGQLTD